MFFVCGGLNDDDEVPAWVEDKMLHDFELNISQNNFKEIKGVGNITFDKKHDKDWAYIPKDQDINEGDLIKVSQQYYQILGIC